jgi:hypothetical protein
MPPHLRLIHLTASRNSRKKTPGCGPTSCALERQPDSYWLSPSPLTLAHLAAQITHAHPAAVDAVAQMLCSVLRELDATQSAAPGRRHAQVREP